MRISKYFGDEMMANKIWIVILVVACIVVWGIYWANQNNYLNVKETVSNFGSPKVTALREKYSVHSLSEKFKTTTTTLPFDECMLVFDTYGKSPKYYTSSKGYCYFNDEIEIPLCIHKRC